MQNYVDYNTPCCFSTHFSEDALQKEAYSVLNFWDFLTLLRAFSYISSCRPLNRSTENARKKGSTHSKGLAKRQHFDFAPDVDLIPWDHEEDQPEGIKTLDHNKSTDMKTLAQALNLHFPDHWLLWPRIHWEMWSSAVSSVVHFLSSPKQQSQSADSGFTLSPCTGTYLVLGMAYLQSYCIQEGERYEPCLSLDWDNACTV